MQFHASLLKSWVFESAPADTPLPVNADEILHGAVVSGFYIIREVTGWQFPQAPVVSYTVATYSLFAARVSAVAAGQIPVLLTIHNPQERNIFIQLSGKFKIFAPANVNN